MIGRAPWRSKMVLNGQDAIAIMTSMTVGPAMTMGRAMASSPAMADPVTAGSQNVAPQPMSWVTDRAAIARTVEIGRASCRERVCQYVSITVVAVSLKTKNIRQQYQKELHQSKTT